MSTAPTRAGTSLPGPAFGGLRRRARPGGLPWPCVHEFIGIATHPAIYDPPSSMAQALEQVEAWLASPAVRLLAETRVHWTADRDFGRFPGLATRNPLVH